MNDLRRYLAGASPFARRPAWLATAALLDGRARPRIRVLKVFANTRKYYERLVSIHVGETGGALMCSGLPSIVAIAWRRLVRAMTNVFHRHRSWHSC